MRSFLEISEKAKRHANNKILIENGMMPQQNQPQQNQPKATNAPEMNDVDLMQGFATNWDAFIKQNNAAMVKMKEIQSAQGLSQALNNLPGELKKVVASLQNQKPTTPAPVNAGNNTAGSAANVQAKPGGPQV